MGGAERVDGASAGARGELTNAEIAEHYARALRECPGVRVDFEKRQEKPAVRLVGYSLMAPGRLKSVAHHNGVFHKCYASNEGEVVETKPDWRRQEDGSVAPILRTLRYPASEPSGQADTPEPDELACYWGAMTDSWVGPENDNSELFGKRIIEGVREPDREADGRLCYVVLWDSGLRGSFEARQRYFVDRQTFMMVRIEGQQVIDGVVVNRCGRHLMTFGNLPGPPWAFSENDLECPGWAREFDPSAVVWSGALPPGTHPPPERASAGDTK